MKQQYTQFQKKYINISHLPSEVWIVNGMKGAKLTRDFKVFLGSRGGGDNLTN